MKVTPEENNHWLNDSIEDFCRQSRYNSLGKKNSEPAWNRPIVGFSRGNDSLYDFFKKDIGDFYLTPVEIFRKTFPGLSFNENSIIVVSWILPQTKKTREDHRRESVFPSERWVRSKQFGEDFNNRLRSFAVSLLKSKGHHSVDPLNSSLYSRKDSPKYGYASTWSERHAAYTAGLGTFGLSDGLITPAGIAVRFGSIITDFPLEPSKRSYQGFRDYCPFYKNQACIECIKRCPSGAISKSGHDKVICRKYIRGDVFEFIKTKPTLHVYACGLCQVNVPCEFAIPLSSSNTKN